MSLEEFVAVLRLEMREKDDIRKPRNHPVANEIITQDKNES
jgi:hypothetical protein